MDGEQMQRLFAFGSNGSGQLGIGHRDDVSAPQECQFDFSGSREIAQLAAGGNHTTIVYDDGRIAVTGDNSDGRCWAISDKQTDIWQSGDKLEPFGGKRVEHITATWSASFAACSEPVLAITTVGTGTAGELGVGGVTVDAREPIVTVTGPRLIRDFGPGGVSVVNLAACMGHVVAVLSNGEVWGWGTGRKGQLGRPSENAWSPRRIHGIPFFAVGAVCGKDFTCVFGSPASGEFVLLGPTGNDRFGIRLKAPSSISGWKQVAASWGSIYVLMQSGEVVSWGRDDRGQLPPPGLPPLESIAAGSEHCIGLTKAGKVLAWGWGEHGNCGIPTDDSGNVKGRWNEIPVSHMVVAVYAGCATSFVVTKGRRE